MPSSESEDFESADEGPWEGTQNKNSRKKRVSSSNYSDSTHESDQEQKKPLVDKIEKPVVPIVENTDGWDDFDIEETVTITATDQRTDKTKVPQDITTMEHEEKSSVLTKSFVPMKPQEKQDTGWDDFDDWEQDVQPKQMQQPEPEHSSETDIKSVADKMSAMSTNEQKDSGSAWGWGGWGMDSLLTSATAGITTLTSHVSQSISTVLETGIGAPDPEELAKKIYASEDTTKSVKESGDNEHTKPENVDPKQSPSDVAFPFGNIISGVTKFVETTGTKVIAGGLDTLETIGKKTMEVLQDGDPGLAKKKAMLGLDSGDRPVLSKLLREAKARADEEDRIREEKREAKEVHYETLFDDFEGLVHLEALEMLSRQVSMRIEERLRSVDPDKQQDIKETLQQVAELCEMPDEEEEEDDDVPEEKTNLADAFQERLQESTEELGLKLQFQPLVKHYTETLEWLDNTKGLSEKNIYKKAVSSLAQCTALCVEIYHKSAEMLLVKSRRSTADEADALTQMTVVLTKHINDLATRFTEKLNTLTTENKDQVHNYITNVFLEAGNSSTYIQNAFHLTLPILQIGAA